MSKNRSNLFLLFDLETSSQLFIGQILCAHFCLVDEKFEPIAQYTKNFYGALSCLEIPEPQAIYTNQIHLSFIQKNGLPENLLAQNIYQFIEHCLHQFADHQIILTGFNIGYFDIPYLRTVLIRNGFNPYFYGKIQYLDLLELARYLSYPCKQIIPKAEPNDKFISFRLENLARHFGLLAPNQEQSHDAAADVELTRKLLAILAQYYEQTFQTPVGKSSLFPPFTISGKEPLTQKDQPLVKNFVVATQVRDPHYKWTQQWQVVVYYQKAAALLLPLEKFDGTRNVKNLRYYNLSWQSLHISPQPITQDIESLGKKVLQTYRPISLTEVFGVSQCDIEQDIYRLPFASMPWIQKNQDTIPPHIRQNKDFRTLFLRYRLRNANIDSANSHSFQKELQKYYQQRYIVGLPTQKQPDQGASTKPNQILIEKTPTFSSMQASLAQLLAQSPAEKQSCLNELAELFKEKQTAGLVASL